MPYQPLPLAQLITQTQQDISQRLPGSQPGVNETTLNAIAYAQAGLSAQEHEHLAWIARQIIPTEADEAELLKHCAFWGVMRKPASRGDGPVQLMLTTDAGITEGVLLQRSDGVVYRITSSLTGKAGTLNVSVEAESAGRAGNAPAGTKLTFVTPQAGSVGVTFVQDNNPDIFPGEGDVKRVADYIRSHDDPATGQPVGQPLGPTVTVFKLTNKPVPFSIRIIPKTPENQAAVKQALTDLLYNESRPGGLVLASSFWRAVAGVKNLEDFEVRSPLTSVQAGDSELLTVGEITWL
ncbi:baseplate J/gp47 family protein [Escherichia coli]|nr:baseplate J/gp47 family protein [Escherichia coli]